MRGGGRGEERGGKGERGKGEGGRGMGREGGRQRKERGGGRLRQQSAQACWVLRAGVVLLDLLQGVCCLAVCHPSPEALLNPILLQQQVQSQWLLWPPPRTQSPHPLTHGSSPSVPPPTIAPPPKHTPLTPPHSLPADPPFPPGRALMRQCVRARTLPTTAALPAPPAARHTAGWSCSTTQPSSSTKSVRG